MFYQAINGVDLQNVISVVPRLAGAVALAKLGHSLATLSAFIAAHPIATLGGSVALSFAALALDVFLVVKQIESTVFPFCF